MQLSILSPIRGLAMVGLTYVVQWDVLSIGDELEHCGDVVALLLGLFAWFLMIAAVTGTEIDTTH